MAIIDHFRARGAIVDRDDALRRAEVVRLDDAGSDGRGIRVPSGHVRADLSADLRIAGIEPGARDGGADRPARFDRRVGARLPHAIARRSSPSTSRRSIASCTRSSTSGAWSATSARRSATLEAQYRTRDEGAARTRGAVPPEARRRRCRIGCVRRAARSTPSSTKPAARQPRWSTMPPRRAQQTHRHGPVPATLVGTPISTGETGEPPRRCAGRARRRRRAGVRAEASGGGTDRGRWSSRAAGPSRRVCACLLPLGHRGRGAGDSRSRARK